MTTDTTISIDMVFEDAALLYISGVTPEGEGVLLKKGDDSLWRSNDIAGEYESPSDATVAAAAALGKANYTVKIDGGQGGEETIEADSLADAMEQARELAADGDWDATDGTLWVDYSVESEDGEESDTGTLTIHPHEPGCDDGGSHDWQQPHEIVGGIAENPGVLGSGGGVKIVECCMKCGCQKTTDTWATRSDTGEQGMESTSYAKPEFFGEHDTHQQVIAEARDNWDDGDITDAIKERFNCREAKVDDDGDVWIADPQDGHWLSAEDMTGLVMWVHARQMI